MLRRLPTFLNGSTSGCTFFNINRNVSKTGLTSPLRILVAFDGCVADSEYYFLQEYRRRFPLEPYIRIEERQNIPLTHQYGRIRPDLVHNVENILRTTGFYTKMTPIKGAIQALKEMQNDEELDVYLCICPIQNSPKSLHEKFQWIQKNLGQVFLERSIVAKDHTMIKADLYFDWTEPHEGNLKVTETGITNCWKDSSWTDNTWREIIALRMNRKSEQGDATRDAISTS